MSKPVLSNYCQLLPFRRAEMVPLIEFWKLLAPLERKKGKKGKVQVVASWAKSCVYDSSSPEVGGVGSTASWGLTLN